MDTAFEKSKKHEAERFSAKDIEKIKAHFEKKAEKMKAFLEAYPVPKELLKK
ncbi:hypothetical protein [Dyadobacter sp. CY326]|uniref:hypothetical protein n=1 Tax=Dyadobacter sp. CY326 TaxID=2907300 RepID=UPI001F2A2E1B|nr:hypothetical protein [Dyadobacter sp. CY326]MCE7063968.1 hypothetical protein [Dyadobacter sp. CY326]